MCEQLRNAVLHNRRLLAPALLPIINEAAVLHRVARAAPIRLLQGVHLPAEATPHPAGVQARAAATPRPAGAPLPAAQEAYLLLHAALPVLPALPVEARALPLPEAVDEGKYYDPVNSN